MTSTHFRSSRQGFSLIEVAIALVIFVVGALAIIRIFPGALSVINNNGDQLTATNINRTTVAALKTENAVPDGTFNVGTTWTSTSVNHTGDWTDSATAVAGVPRFNYSLPTTNNSDLADSALTKYRGIQGESAKVIDIGGAKYVLTQFPAVAAYAPVISKDESVDNARIKNTGELTDDAGTALTVPADSLLYVSYRYNSNAPTGTVWGVQDEAVPPSSGALQVTPPTTGQGAIVPTDGVIAGPVEVRLRRFIAAGSFASAGDNARGLIQFTVPAGITINNGDTVSVDYVADWSTLLQTGVPAIVPEDTTGGAGYRQIALGAPFVEDQDPNAVVSLLVTNSGTPTLRRASYGSGGFTSDGTSSLSINSDPEEAQNDFRAGRVTFDMAGVEGARARVAYKTRDGWMQQLSVAASSYKPFVSATAPEPWRDYVLDGSYLYFYAGEAGKAITVSYTTASETFTARPFVIEETLISNPGTALTSATVSRVLLTDSDGNPVTPTSITAVRGTSVTVRTAYLNGDRYTQALLTSNRSFVQ